MKRCISLLVAVALLLGLVPAAAFAKTTATPSPVSRGTNVRARGVKDEPGLVTWDFEVNPTATGWTFEDSDGDGNNWNWVQDSTYAHESTGSIMSASYSGSALSPDNWAISPVFTLASEDPTISFWVRNYSGTYPETFGVFIRRAGTEQFTDVATNLSVTGSTYVQVSYPITTFAGEDVQIAIRHYNCTDQWRFYIDDVTVTGSIDESVITSINVTGFPTRIYAGQTPADVLANVAVPEDAHYIIDQLSAYDLEADEELYEDDEFVEGRSYLFGAMVETDLDYTFADGAVMMANNGNLELDPGYSSVNGTVAFIVPVALVCGGDAPIYGWYFETADELEGWSVIDNDGDGSNWYWLDAESLGEPLAYEGEGYMGSPSWNSVALTPDNFLLTPDMEIPEGTTTLSFYAAGVGANWCAEHFAVYVMTEDAESVDDLVELIPETVATADYVNYTADLSDYAGQTIRVAFRHFNCTDLNWLRLDQVEVFNEGGEEEPELIDTVAIEGFTVPAWGENPDFDIEVPEDAHYSIDYTAWLCDGEQMIRQDVFDSETSSYMMSIVLVPEEGYEFADEVEATINGGTEYIGVANNTGEGTFHILTIEFTVEEPEPQPELIDTIEILDFVVPAWGENPYYNVTVPTDVHYTIDYTDWNWWSDELDDGDILTPSETFDNESYVYYQYFEIIPDEGYAFADQVTVLINGDATIAENHGWSEYSSLYWIYTIDYSVEEPAEPGEPVLGYYFESNYEVADYIFLDEDGDGYTWSRVTASSYAYEGEGCMGSRYNSSSEVNNWMILPEFHVPETDPSMTFYARERTTTYGTEYLGIYVGTDPEDLDSFVQIGTMLVIDHVDYR
ncbi:MAG: choice-of-anchor J domain-containing protein, partial [Clostridia bacterium]|nr:choice-of-anchor J domain-containing protein [Clostridia bacterium]